jgi:hypothetical protein
MNRNFDEDEKIDEDPDDDGLDDGKPTHANIKTVFSHSVV